MVDTIRRSHAAAERSARTLTFFALAGSGGKVWLAFGDAYQHLACCTLCGSKLKSSSRSPPDTFGETGDPFPGQKLARKDSVCSTDVSEASAHSGSTEDFGLKVRAVSAGFHQLVDQQLQCMTAITDVLA